MFIGKGADHSLIDIPELVAFYPASFIRIKPPFLPLALPAFSNGGFLFPFIVSAIQAVEQSQLSLNCFYVAGMAMGAVSVRHKVRKVTALINVRFL